VSITPFRTLLILATAVATLFVGVSAVAADVPGVSVPPKPSDSTTVATIGTTGSTTTTPTTVAPSPTTTPTTVPPAAITKILPAPTTTAVPGAETKIVGAPPATTGANGGNGTASSSPTTTVAGPPPASLTPAQVDDILHNQVKSGANSTAALMDALTPLQNLGMSQQEAAALVMGPFPVEGLANWTDDFGDPRDGPPPHPHQGNDLFTQFDTPVRAPADGTVRYETGGLGGLAAYVTTADGTYYYMAHLDSYATDLASGAPVTQGRIVGFAGDTGNAKGGPPHVHFEIHPGGGAAVNPKPIVDGWVAAALARVPAVIASFQPATADGTSDGGDGGIPQILVATGMTRRFSAPSLSPPPKTPSTDDFNRAVLGPLTPPALAPMLSPVRPD
jgi:hypothetical protein